MGLLPYGDRLRAQRRMMQQVFNSIAVKDFRQTQEEHVERLLRSILEAENNLKFYESAILYSLSYTFDVVTNIAMKGITLPQS